MKESEYLTVSNLMKLKYAKGLVCDTLFVGDGLYDDNELESHVHPILERLSIMISILNERLDVEVDENG